MWMDRDVTLGGYHECYFGGFCRQDRVRINHCEGLVGCHVGSGGRIKECGGMKRCEGGKYRLDSWC